MPSPPVELVEVCKRYGSQQALDDVSFSAPAGSVTALIGPNGSGKTTALRVLLGLERADRGVARVCGARYADLTTPVHRVGALLSAGWVHPKRTARDHLRWIAAASLLPDERVERALDTVGLVDVADQRVGGFSLGMRQRLGIATTILGDPEVLVYDEPLNGLDQDGVEWVRRFFLEQAARGRTVLVSSHLLTEVEHTASHVVVLGRGGVIFQGEAARLTASTEPAVEVELASEQTVPGFVAALEAGGRHPEVVVGGRIRVPGADLSEIAQAAHACGASVRSVQEHGSLASAYAELTVGQGRFSGRDQESRS
ncbi:ATP-binding cassette domain-containing protein [Luteipulveratus sp. YIM 133132]|uniref:ATP-binding cassette domain-containing protein n=1 Tax=Luteipulveratus flavus TaxID=3031728 RepID=UPI0023B0235D|nr:ATP-binding cassette domain-containing protein [Luteipulveratus sp. YIM 133132]MDE9364934.1 ATP-binding cassette domain-containing protein [Luteipulveratus sp. YIM 133132]